MDVFIFGTLLHVPLLKVVSGDDRVQDRLQWAVRPGYAVSRVEGQVFPMIHADPDAVAEGVIVEGLDDAALARLDYYEKAFGYDRVAFSVLDADQQTRAVTAYVPQEGRWTPAEPWDRDGWIAQFGAVTALTAEEAMAAMGHLTAAQMGHEYPNMMTRAASRLRAQGEPARGDLGRDDFVVLRH